MELDDNEVLVSRTKYHKIRSGESLGLIAEKHIVSFRELKKWNRLRGITIHAGKSLKERINQI